jgi:CRISPR-associated endonuclease Cas1
MSDRQPEPATSTLNTIQATYTRESAATRVIVADGFGIKITTRRGHLVVHDGLGDVRSERIVPRVGSPVQRVVIVAPNGYATLGALQWCADNGVQLVQLTRDGNVVMTGHQERTADVILIRTQAATTPDTALSIVKALLTIKLEGQSKILRDLGTADAATRTERELSKLADATTIDIMRLCEGRAAMFYFGSWSSRVEIRFDKASIVKIPAHWRNGFSERGSVLSKGKRHATNPLNALLNYAYSLAYAEARIACIAAGLDPRLGYLHADSEGRDSLALDIMETVRPEVDRFIMRLLTTRAFTAADFVETTGRGETPAGTVRLVAPLTHEICEAAIQWQAPLREASEMVRALLLGTRTARRTRKPRASTARSTDQALVNSLVPDELWDAVRPLLPLREGNAGVRPVDDRVVISMLVYRHRNGIPWNRFPARFGVSDGAVRGHVRSWRALGCWPAIAEAAGLPLNV